MNVHHRIWLHYSNANTATGEELYDICQEFAMKQCAKSPTRGEYLLDLIFTDWESVDARVLSMLADHNAVFIKMPVSIPVASSVSRTGWIFKHAD